MSEPLHTVLEAIERALTRCAAGQSHPSTVRIFGVRREGRHLVIEREKLDGIPLSDILRKHCALSFDPAINCLRPLAAAIDHAVENHLPALDLAVASIIVQTSGDLLLPKAPPLALTVLDDLKAARQQNKTVVFNPLQIDLHDLALQTIEKGLASLPVLAYELFSGRLAPSGKGDYRPIAALSETGNRCLRRAFEQPTSFIRLVPFIDELSACGRRT